MTSAAFDPQGRRRRRPDGRNEEHAAGREFRVAMPETCVARTMRRLRRKGAAPAEIAKRFGATDEEVAAALGAARGRRVEPNHISLAVTRATGEFFRSLAEPGEVTWQAMDRIADELRRRRTQDGGA